MGLHSTFQEKTKTMKTENTKLNTRSYNSLSNGLLGLDYPGCLVPLPSLEEILTVGDVPLPSRLR